METRTEEPKSVFESFKEQLEMIDPRLNGTECFKKVAEVMASQKVQFPLKDVSKCLISKRGENQLLIRLERPTSDLRTINLGHDLIFNISTYTRIDTSGLDPSVDISTIDISRLPRITVPTISFVGFKGGLRSEKETDVRAKQRLLRRVEGERSALGGKVRGVVDEDE